MSTKDLNVQLQEVQIQKDKIKAGLMGGIALILAIPAMFFCFIMLWLMYALITSF
jgi:hypothetical protein